jgi:PAS domain S-box-containing protein
LSAQDDASIEEDAAGFDGEDIPTSPEIHALGESRRPTAPRNPRLLLAMTDVDRRQEVALEMEADGWAVDLASDGNQILDLAAERRADVVVVDTTMQAKGVISIPNAIRAEHNDAPVRIVARLPHGSADEVAGALADGYDDFLAAHTGPMEFSARITANLSVTRHLAEIHRQRRDAAILLELTQALASSLNLHLILHTVSRLIADVIDLERCSIILSDVEHDEAIILAASEDRSVRDLRIQMSNYPELQRCVTTGAPVLITDVESDPLLEAVRDHILEAGIRSMALFPIVFEERVIGVLFLRSVYRSTPLNTADVQFGQTVASSCAVAIRNARLFDSFRDQTERMNHMRIAAERRLESVQLFENFFEHAADGMAIVDDEGKMLYVNKEGRQLLRFEMDAIQNIRFTERLAADSQDSWHDLLDQVRQGRFKHAKDFYILRGDGEERIFSLTAGGAGQDTDFMVLSFRDVTETREMEIELRTTKEFLENLIDNSLDAIVASDMQGNIILFNKRAERILGYRSSDVIGQMHVEILYPPGTAAEIMEALRADGDGGKGRLETQRRQLRTAQGDLVPVNMTASIIYEDGDEVATVGVFSDLRERIKMERRLSEAQQQLMHTEKARVAAELAGMAAHELNQPLTSVLGYAEMLKRRIKEEDTRARRPVDIIFREAERMSDIVRKIGRITKYETKIYGASTMMMDLEKASAPDQRNAQEGPSQETEADDEEDTGKQRAAPGVAPGKTSRVPRPKLSPNTESSDWWKAAAPKKSPSREEMVNSVIRADTVDASTARRVAERRMAETEAQSKGGPFSKDSDEVTRRIKLDQPLDDS